MRFASFVSLGLSILTLSACSFAGGGVSGELHLTELPVPEGIEFDGADTVSWSSVSNSDGYTIKVNSREYNTTALSYTVSFSEDCSFTFSIKARGKSLYTSDSPWSQTFTWNYKKETASSSASSSGNQDTSSVSEPSSSSEVESGNYLGTYLNTGIGSTVNVIAATNYADYIKGFSVLDKGKLANDDLFTLDRNVAASQIKSNSTQSISDFVSENSVICNIDVHSKSKVKTMFTNVDVGLHSSASFNYSSYSDKYYYSLDAFIPKYNIYLNNYSVSNNLRSLFSSSYLNALEDLYNNQSQQGFLSFFKTCGTHIIASGIFGGRLNAYYSAVTNKATIDASVSANLKTTIESGISAVNQTGTTVDVTTSVKDVLKTSEFETAFYAMAYGGSSFTATTIDGLNSHYVNWATSFDSADTKSVIIDYPENGLVALWDILPDKYISMKSDMENAFIEYYQNSYDTFIDSFTLKDGSSYYVDSPLLSCALDNGYNYDKPDDNANNAHFALNIEFGKFVVKNVGEQEENSFGLLGLHDASVYYRVTHDCDNLPLDDNMTSRYLSDDTFSSGFYKMPGGDPGNKTVHQGLLVAYITFEDGSIVKKIIETDIFNGKKAGDEVLIADGINKACTIEIAICFEVTMWSPGFLGISDDYWMDYRINHTFKFK